MHEANASLPVNAKQDIPLRHSGAMRSIEPGIHNPHPWLWIPGLRQGRIHDVQLHIGE
jgi:hypothetical protein